MNNMETVMTKIHKGLVALLALAMVGGGSSAFAQIGEIPISPSQCYPAASSGATKEGPSEESGANAPTVRIDFPDGSTTTAFCIFPFPHNAPYKDGCTGLDTPWDCCTGVDAGCNSNWQFSISRYSSTNVGNVVWDFDMCVMEGDNTAGPGVFTCSSNASTTDTGIQTNVGFYFNGLAFGPPSTILDPRFHQGVIRIQRIGADGSDTETGTATFDQGTLLYYASPQ